MTRMNARIAGFAWLTFALCLVGAAPTALASFGEVDINYPYVALGGIGTPVQNASGVYNGVGSVKLTGWTFPFGGQSFNQIEILSDGWLAVGNGSATCGCSAGATTDYQCPECPPSVPSGAIQNCQKFPCTAYFSPPFSPGLIAPWWQNFGQEQFNFFNGQSLP